MIVLEKTSFLDGIRAVKTSISKNNLNPILSTINLKTENGGVVMTTTDLNNSARVVIEANYTENINVCINADKLEAVVNVLDDIIKIELDNTILKLKSEKTHFDLLTINKSDFPEISFDTSDDKIVISKEDFVSIITKAVIATTITQGHILNGVCFTFNGDKGYEIATTDGNRLCQIKKSIPVTKSGQYTIPHVILSNVAKIAKNDIEIQFLDNNKILFKTGNFICSSHLLSGVFPKYQQLIPTTNSKKIIVNKVSLLHSLEKVVIMSDNRSFLTTFDFKQNKLKLSTKCDSGYAEDEIEIQSNDEIKICFNYRYLLDAIRVMETEDIIFELENDTSACVVKADYIYVIMPVRANY